MRLTIYDIFDGEKTVKTFENVRSFFFTGWENTNWAEACIRFNDRKSYEIYKTFGVVSIECEEEEE